MGKQKLTAKGAATKKARDIAYAKGITWKGKDTSVFKRTEKKRRNQNAGQCSTSDIHHVNGSLTNTKRVPISENRDVWKNGDRKKKTTKKKKTTTKK
tara:strand:+ start:464 stop:754 length:291 start_codon:yes stop_codon:yes gene_type:complete